MQFDLEPILSRIFIKRTVVSQVGSIVIPNNSREFELSEGDVIATGPDCEIVKVGDSVLFGKYAGAVIERHDEKYVVLNEEDVIAKIKGGEDVK